jgi:nicotinamidase-related amidase
MVSGVVTHFCVESTAREAADYGFQVIIVDDCCAGWAPDLHEKTLKTFELLYGFVLPFETVMKKISKKFKKVNPVSISP